MANMRVGLQKISPAVIHSARATVDNRASTASAGPHPHAAGYSTSDMLWLQRAVGNHALTKIVTSKAGQHPPALQAKLMVGPARDRYEDEADRIAAQVQRTPTQSNDEDDGVQRTPVINRLQRSAAIGLEGGPVDSNLERKIHDAQSGGSSLPSTVQSSLESKLNADLSSVKVHTDNKSAQISRDLGAKAFTHKNHIFYGAGQSPHDMKLTTHEAVHTIQQGAVKQNSLQPKRGGKRAGGEDGAVAQRTASGKIARQAQEGGIIQRAVGFEFEDPTWTVFKLQPGRTFRDPNSVRWYNPWSWSMGNVARPGSEKTDEEQKEEKYKGKNIWQSEENLEQHINNRVGQFNLQTGPKKGTLHQGKDYKIEPDGPYSEDGVTNRMDLEIVTEPFPETTQGRKRLVDALEDMSKVINGLPARGKWNPDTAFEYSKFVTPAQNGFSAGDIYLYGGRPGGAFKPQVTSGVDLASLPSVMETLGRPDSESSLVEGEKYGPVRKMVYGTSSSTNLAGDSTINAVGNASIYAKRVIDNLHDDGVIAKGEPGVDKLRGFLALAILNMTVLSTTIKEGIKNVMPLLSRYSMVTLFEQIPETVRSQLQTPTGKTALLARVDEVLKLSLTRFLSSKYRNAEGFVRNSAGKGLDGPMIQPFLKEKVDGTEQRATTLEAGLTFTRKEWLLNILDGSDLLTPGDLLKFLNRSEATEEQKKAAKEYDKSIAIFLRGYGNTSNVKDVSGETRGGLALFENRNVNPWQGVSGKAAGLSMDEVKTLALDYFDWLVSVKQAREDSLEREKVQKERLRDDSHKARFVNFWG